MFLSAVGRRWRWGEMTTDVTMIHRNEEKHLAAAAARSTQGSLLFLFRFSSFSSSICLTFMPANTPSLTFYIWLLRGLFPCAQWLAVAPGLESLRRPINGAFVKLRVPGTPRPPWKPIKRTYLSGKKLMSGQEIRVKPSTTGGAGLTVYDVGLQS